MLGSDKVMGVLEAALDVRSDRHKVIAANIANMDTPGYKAMEIDFRKVLEAQTGEGVTLVTTNPGHIRLDGAAETRPMTGGAAGGSVQGLDENTVNVEQEMVKIAENTLMYNASAQILNGRFRQLKDAMK